MTGPRVVAIGGGHGLAVTLRACQPWAGELTAVVSVADDGGSSGRLRLDDPTLPAPGDLRRCLTALAAPERVALAAALEHRFDDGDLAGHAAGNVLLAALAEECGELSQAAGVLADALGVQATVLPATDESVHLVARTVAGEVVGQVAVEAAGVVDTLRCEPPDPSTPKLALDALAAAELVVIGPGSFYGSVLAALTAPSLQRAVAASPGRRVLVHNLFAVDSAADRVAVLARHGVPVDDVVVHGAGAEVAAANGLAHDPEKLGAALRGLSAR